MKCLIYFCYVHIHFLKIQVKKRKINNMAMNFDSKEPRGVAARLHEECELVLGGCEETYAGKLAPFLSPTGSIC